MATSPKSRHKSTSLNAISVRNLSRLIGTPSAPVVLDLRTEEDFAADPTIVPAARRQPFEAVAELVPELLNQHVVVYCQKGLKISEGGAALLASHGVNAEYLEGGHFGWRDAAEPLIPVDKIPTLADTGSTRWVTRLRPKVDRIACPWLIRRFIDPQAEFLFVSAANVLPVAERFNATPFDMEDIFWSHRADQCTFDTMIDEFNLGHEALLRLALIVRGADTDHLTLAPQCAGLLAASLGLSRMHGNDHEQLEAGMHLYDAFYRWCRDAVSETHVWPGPA